MLADRAGGADRVRSRTGGPLGAESVAAKLAWLARHHPDRLDGARFILTPRDLVVARLCGRYGTDVTMASRSGLFDLDGSVVAELAGPAAALLPTVFASDEVVGDVLAPVAGELGVPGGIPVVIGAGDRACEVIGTGAGPDVPMVSWGTTASVVVPTDHRPEGAPAGLVVSRAAAPATAADGEAGWLLEGGLSSAGAFLGWLADLTARPLSDLVEEAADSPVGARGLVAVPWLGGARAPWWRDGARAGFVGASLDHAAGDFARAAIESVAADVRRCLEAAARRDGPAGGAAGRWRCCRRRWRRRAAFRSVGPRRARQCRGALARRARRRLRVARGGASLGRGGLRRGGVAGGPGHRPAHRPRRPRPRGHRRRS